MAGRKEMQNQFYRAVFTALLCLFNEIVKVVLRSDYSGLEQQQYPARKPGSLLTITALFFVKCMSLFMVVQDYHRIFFQI